MENHPKLLRVGILAILKAFSLNDTDNGITIYAEIPKYILFLYKHGLILLFMIFNFTLDIAFNMLTY